MTTREMIESAPRRLKDAPAGKKIVLIYAGLMTALSAACTLLTFLLQLQIEKSGGLSGMGMRTNLSAIQTMLPIVQSVLAMCLTVGYRSAMLRIARGQYASPQGLRLGFSRFWVLLRSGILRMLIYLAIGMSSVYIASAIYVLTPLGDPLIEFIEPLLGNLGSAGLVLDDAMMTALTPIIMPMLWITLGIFLIFAIPVSLQYRMVDYVIIDRPGFGALMALRESRLMMRGNKRRLLGLDLRLWWYYLAMTAATVVCYGDRFLPIFGMAPSMAAYWIFYVLYLAVQFAIYYYLTNRIEVTYALAYDTVRPRERETGAVLGNIFQM